VWQCQNVPRRLIGSVDELKRKQTLKFSYREEGIGREGFLAWFKGRVVAYENVCRHIPITLDYGDARFFNAEQSHFVCQTHGATYEPLTGKCIAGPCVGASLKRLEVEVAGNEIWFEEPE
jgi:nitrite reductase/ring-hydroxylating ferredoxin subunit